MELYTNPCLVEGTPEIKILHWSLMSKTYWNSHSITRALIWTNFVFIIALFLPLRIGLLKKKSKHGAGGSWGYTFLKKRARIFKFVTLPLENPEKTPRNFATLTPFGSFKFKNQDPRKFHMSFSWTLLEVSLLF